MRRSSSLLLALVGLLVIWSSALPATPAAGDGESFTVEHVDEQPCKSDCPGDDENGECPPNCDACPCCPIAASAAARSQGPSISPGESLAETRAIGGSGQAREGARSRVFHPPRRAAS